MATPTIKLPMNPDGTQMTQEQFDKLFATFVKSRVTGTAKEKAKAHALKDLKAAHQAEYDQLVAKYSPKA